MWIDSFKKQASLASQDFLLVKKYLSNINIKYIMQYVLILYMFENMYYSHM